MPDQVVSRFQTRDLGRPIRVVFFGGAFLEPAAVDFLTRLEEHPDVSFVGGYCQSAGFGLCHRVIDIVRRRGLLAPAVLGASAVQSTLRFLKAPRAAWVRQRRARRALARLGAVPNIHASAVLERVRRLRPDLGLVYGSPILKPELFQIPTFGTLGIHHGRLPDYRGKKTAFWAMLNGEAAAGVTIQRINAGIDTGEIVSAGEVPIAGKRYGRVDAELQELGVNLYMDAVLAVKRGQAMCRPQPTAKTPLYRQPGARDLVRLWWRQLRLNQQLPRPQAQ